MRVANPAFDVTPHELVTAIVTEKGVARDLAERSLAHTIKDKVEAAYHRTDLLEQRRKLMNEWEAFVIDKPSHKS